MEYRAPRSVKIPAEARTDILPSPFGSHAKPRRGVKMLYRLYAMLFNGSSFGSGGSLRDGNFDTRQNGARWVLEGAANLSGSGLRSRRWGHYCDSKRGGQNIDSNAFHFPLHAKRRNRQTIWFQLRYCCGITMRATITGDLGAGQVTYSPPRRGGESTASARGIPC